MSRRSPSLCGLVDVSTGLCQTTCFTFFSGDFLLIFFSIDLLQGENPFSYPPSSFHASASLRGLERWDGKEIGLVALHSCVYAEHICLSLALEPLDGTHRIRLLSCRVSDSGGRNPSKVTTADSKLPHRGSYEYVQKTVQRHTGTTHLPTYEVCRKPNTSTPWEMCIPHLRSDRWTWLKIEHDTIIDRLDTRSTRVGSKSKSRRRTSLQAHTSTTTVV